MEVNLGIKRTATLCLLRCGTKFLLLKRFKEPHIGLYTPVGGKLDAFENPLKAAIRETEEETGIKVPSMKYCGLLIESSPTKYNWTCFTYLADIPYQEPPECNEGILEWIDFEDINNISTPETDRFIYEYVRDGKYFMFNVEYDESLKIIEMVEEMENVQLIG